MGVNDFVLHCLTLLKRERMEVKEKNTGIRRSRKIPQALVYERLNGVDLYYKGYKEVLKGTKTKEEIVGSSSLQAAIITFVLRVIFNNIDWNKFNVLTNEPGLHIDKGSNLSGDILIYENTVLTPDKITNRYATVPALIHLEVDISADLEATSDVQYIANKINLLLEFGTQKVIWIFTGSRRVLIATPNADWVWINWDKDVAIMNGISFCVGKFLSDQGIEI